MPYIDPNGGGGGTTTNIDAGARSLIAQLLAIPGSTAPIAAGAGISADGRQWQNQTAGDLPVPATVTAANMLAAGFTDVTTGGSTDSLNTTGPWAGAANAGDEFGLDPATGKQYYVDAGGNWQPTLASGTFDVTYDAIAGAAPADGTIPADLQADTTRDNADQHIRKFDDYTLRYQFNKPADTWSQEDRRQNDPSPWLRVTVDPTGATPTAGKYGYIFEGRLYTVVPPATTLSEFKASPDEVLYTATFADTPTPAAVETPTDPEALDLAKAINAKAGSPFQYTTRAGHKITYRVYSDGASDIELVRLTDGLFTYGNDTATAADLPPVADFTLGARFRFVSTEGTHIYVVDNAVAPTNLGPDIGEGDAGGTDGLTEAEVDARVIAVQSFQLYTGDPTDVAVPAGKHRAIDTTNPDKSYVPIGGVWAERTSDVIAKPLNLIPDDGTYAGGVDRATDQVEFVDSGIINPRGNATIDKLANSTFINDNDQYGGANAMDAGMVALLDAMNALAGDATDSKRYGHAFNVMELTAAPDNTLSRVVGGNTLYLQTQTPSPVFRPIDNMNNSTFCAWFRSRAVDAALRNDDSAYIDGGSIQIDTDLPDIVLPADTWVFVCMNKKFPFGFMNISFPSIYMQHDAVLEVAIPYLAQGAMVIPPYNKPIRSVDRTPAVRKGTLAAMLNSEASLATVWSTTDQGSLLYHRGEGSNTWLAAMDNFAVPPGTNGPYPVVVTDDNGSGKRLKVTAANVANTVYAATVLQDNDIIYSLITSAPAVPLDSELISDGLTCKTVANSCTVTIGDNTPLNGERKINKSLGQNAVVVGFNGHQISVPNPTTGLMVTDTSISFSGNGWALVKRISNTVEPQYELVEFIGSAIPNPSAPTVNPTINNLVANTSLPTLTGTATVAPGDIFTVEVDGVVYTEGAGDLTLAGTSWSLAVPAGNEIADGVHEVIATVSNVGGDILDQTNNELTVNTVIETVLEYTANIGEVLEIPLGAGSVANIEWPDASTENGVSGTRTFTAVANGVQQAKLTGTVDTLLFTGGNAVRLTDIPGGIQNHGITQQSFKDTGLTFARRDHWQNNGASITSVPTAYQDSLVASTEPDLFSDLTNPAMTNLDDALRGTPITPGGLDDLTFRGFPANITNVTGMFQLAVSMDAPTPASMQYFTEQTRFDDFFNGSGFDTWTSGLIDNWVKATHMPRFMLNCNNGANFTIPSGEFNLLVELVQMNNAWQGANCTMPPQDVFANQDKVTTWFRCFLNAQLAGLLVRLWGTASRPSITNIAQVLEGNQITGVVADPFCPMPAAPNFNSVLDNNQIAAIDDPIFNGFTGATSATSALGDNPLQSANFTISAAVPVTNYTGFMAGNGAWIEGNALPELWNSHAGSIAGSANVFPNAAYGITGTNEASNWANVPVGWQ